MSLKVEIEKHSGFCGGVIRAIGTAEKYLSEGEGRRLHSLGAIVHNEEELHRLEEKGLVTISKEDLERMARESRQPGTILIRAHGEPPQTYSMAKEMGIEVIDCTCPVVLRLQKRIREAWERLKTVNGQLMIFGKIGHAEVLGLVGQAEGQAIVIENLPMLEAFIGDGTVDLGRPLEIFSQTTKSPVEYSEICTRLEQEMKAPLEVHDTICSQVASRHEELSEFASRHDVILFVAGASSSNGKVLYNLCRSVNARTYQITSETDIDRSWFKDGEKVGICGATSTPRWLLDKVAGILEGINLHH